MAAFLDHIVYNWGLGDRIESKEKVVLKRNPIIFICITLILIFGASGCSSLFGPQTTPTPTYTITPVVSDTPIFTDTPIPSDTPLPSATFTETIIPSPTDTLFPTRTWTPVVPTETAKPSEAILIFYINKEVKGPFGCGEDLWYINTGVRRSKDDLPGDIRYALYNMFTLRQPTIGILYHAGYASILAVGEVQVDSEGIAYVWLTGAYIPTNDPCDSTRFKDQIKRTVTQFPQVTKAIVYVNAAKMEDVFKRRK